MTNDGVTFKLQCDVTGQFIWRDWQVCRERKICSKPPPIPDFSTGLWLSDSINVAEFDSAVYQCRDNDTMYVPNTADGKFRVMCQKSGNFQPTVTFKWPNCTAKPSAVCMPIPSTPPGYVSLNPPAPFLQVLKIVFNRNQCPIKNFPRKFMLHLFATL